MPCWAATAPARSTTLHLLSGALTPYRGTVQRTGRIGVLPQDPQALFVKKTVREDLYEAFDGQKLETALREKRLEQAVALCRLSPLLDRHPYDLSGGEQQRAALCKVLLLDPEILLLDEPTKGLVAQFKQELAGHPPLPDSGRRHGGHGQSRRGVLRPLRPSLRPVLRRQRGDGGRAPPLLLRQQLLYHLR